MMLALLGKVAAEAASAYPTITEIVVSERAASGLLRYPTLRVTYHAIPSRRVMKAAKEAVVETDFMRTWQWSLDTVTAAKDPDAALRVGCQHAARELHEAVVAATLPVA